jgi:hypothetical protein
MSIRAKLMLPLTGGLGKKLTAFFWWGNFPNIFCLCVLIYLDWCSSVYVLRARFFTLYVLEYACILKGNACLFAGLGSYPCCMIQTQLLLLRGQCVGAKPHTQSQPQTLDEKFNQLQHTMQTVDWVNLDLSVGVKKITTILTSFGDLNPESPKKISRSLSAQTLILMTRRQKPVKVFLPCKCQFLLCAGVKALLLYSLSFMYTCCFLQFS